MKPFQLIIIVIFLAAGTIALFIFAGVIKIGDNGGNNANKAKTIVRMWGTIPGDRITPVLTDFNQKNPTYEIRYSAHSVTNFEQDLLEAIVANSGPDLFLLPDNLAYQYVDKIRPFTYASFPMANFKGSFGSAGDVFVNQKGILALPVSIDPLVMYYNRTILDTNGIIYPPAYWDEFSNLVSKLTEKDLTSNQISKSTVALGQFSNVKNAKDILSALFIQSGNKIVVESSPGIYISVLDSSRLGESTKGGMGPVLAFYTSFADPLNALYSWNKALPSSDLFFISGKLALYFGYASEAPELSRRNPNLNFGASPLPQVKGASFKATKARVTGVAVATTARNQTAAFAVANLLALGNDFPAGLAKSIGVPPARRDLLSSPGTGQFDPIFYNTALYGSSWLDPNPTSTNTIFQTMVEGVLSNAFTPADSVRDASGKLNLVLKR